jgi:hypothetical protein
MHFFGTGRGRRHISTRAGLALLIVLCVTFAHTQSKEEDSSSASRLLAVPTRPLVISTQ